MAHKKVLNPKEDFWEHNRTETNRQRDIDALKMAKQQEAERMEKKRLKTVKIDAHTIVLVEANRCTDEVRKSFRERLQMAEKWIKKNNKKMAEI